MRRYLVRPIVALLLLTAVHLATPSPASAESIRYGFRCEGARAYRCAWFNYDPVYKRLRGYAAVYDTTGDQVFVTARAILQVYIQGDGWVTVADDGESVSQWEVASDTTGVNMASCVSGRRYRSVGAWAWGIYAPETGFVFSYEKIPC